MFAKKLISVLLSWLALTTGAAILAQTSKEVALPEGSRMRLSFDKALSSETSQSGERFSATVEEAISVNNRVVVPRGSVVEGVVTLAKPGKRGVIGLQRKEGELDVRWESLILPNGVRRELAAHAVAIEDPRNKGQIKDEEGTLKGESSAKRDVLQTGIGAGVGAGIGAIVGGGKGTAVGAAVGGLAGLGTAALRKGHDIEIEKGTKIIVQLDRPMTFVVGELASHRRVPLGQGMREEKVPPEPGMRQERVTPASGKGKEMKIATVKPQDGKVVDINLIFSEQDRGVIREYFSDPGHLPPGLAKRGRTLPPGLQKQLVRKGHLPPGLQKRVVPFPVEVERRLTVMPVTVIRVILGRHALLLHKESHMILDVLHDVLH